MEGRDEACLAVLDGLYGDGLTWHDIACHHIKPVVCERRKNPWKTIRWSREGERSEAKSRSNNATPRRELLNTLPSPSSSSRFASPGRI